MTARSALRMEASCRSCVWRRSQLTKLSWVDPVSTAGSRPRGMFVLPLPPPFPPPPVGVLPPPPVPPPFWGWWKGLWPS